VRVRTAPARERTARRSMGECVLSRRSTAAGHAQAPPRLSRYRDRYTLSLHARTWLRNMAGRALVSSIQHARRSGKSEHGRHANLDLTPYLFFISHILFSTPAPPPPPPTPQPHTTRRPHHTARSPRLLKPSPLPRPRPQPGRTAAVRCPQHHWRRPATPGSCHLPGGRTRGARPGLPTAQS
jgi:hypothetical protein